MDDKKYYIEKFSELSDFELKRQLSEGKEAYREGIYDLLIDEANKRNIDINSEVIYEIKTEHNKIKANNLIKFGYFFSILGGLASIIIGIYLLSSKDKIDNGKSEYKYDEETRKHGWKIFIIGLIMAIIGWRVIVLLLNLLF